MHSWPRKASSILGTGVCLMLLLHLLLALVIIVAPGVSSINPVLRFYRRFVVLGPFFDESRIVSSPHVLISAYGNGAWSEEVDFACRDVAEPAAGKFEAVQRRSFETFLAGQISNAKHRTRRSRALAELENYLRSRPTFYDADSLDVTYIRRNGFGTSAYTDTVYHHKFKR